MTFADKLQKLRKAKRLSQEDLAERCGVTRQSISKWETGLGYPETEKLLMLCDLLEVNLDYLLRDIKKNTMKKINKKKYLCMLPMLENGYKFFCIIGDSSFRRNL